MTLSAIFGQLRLDRARANHYTTCMTKTPDDPHMEPLIEAEPLALGDW